MNSIVIRNTPWIRKLHTKINFNLFPISELINKKFPISSENRKYRDVWGFVWGGGRTFIYFGFTFIE